MTESGWQSEFLETLSRLVDRSPGYLRAADPWDLSPIEELKVALFLETITGEHYDQRLLEYGIQSATDCVAVCRVKLAHGDATPTALVEDWTDLLDEVSE